MGTHDCVLGRYDGYLRQIDRRYYREKKGSKSYRIPEGARVLFGASRALGFCSDFFQRVTNIAVRQGRLFVIEEEYICNYGHRSYDFI